MAVLIGSARSSYGNTTPGDQHSGLEVSTQNWYLHSKGWVVLRAKNPVAREKIAVAMEHACANNNIGYSQPTRLMLYNDVKAFGFDPAKTTKPVNCDCSSLVRVCVSFAGIMVSNFITSTEASALMATEAFDKLTDDKHCKRDDYLLRGDILVTRTKGHTVVVLSDGARAVSVVVNTAYKLGDRILKNGMGGDDVKELQGYLIQLSYSCGDWGVDGEFGDATELSVRAFQQDHDCEVDGEVGPETVSALNAAMGESDGGAADAKTVVIYGGNCYVRTAPNTSGVILGVAHNGDRLTYQGQTSVNGWNLVVYNNANGWVSGKYSRVEA